MNILEPAKALIKEEPLCNNCLGRFFSKLLKSLNNHERGEVLKRALAMEADRLEAESGEEARETLLALAKSGFKPAMKALGIEQAEPCFICGGLMSSLSNFVEKAEEALKSYDFNTILVGTRVPGGMVEREDSLRSKFSLNYGESIKSEINRELKRALTQRMGKKADFSSPDIVMIIDLSSSNIEVRPSPVFVFGRYLKLEAGIPQNKWFCSKCSGLGCEHCNWTGKRYPISVEELVTLPLIELFEGKEAKFHGAGREDVDAKVLGRGRPFIVEIKEPKRRLLDPSLLGKKVNEYAKGKVEVHELRYSSRDEVRKLKMLASIREKTYVVKVSVEGWVSGEELRMLEEKLSGAVIKQRTPLRVLHRRADKVRFKKVYSFKAEPLEENLVKFTIRGQGGLYIKELITGDEARTTPSVFEVLGRKMDVLEFIVVHVE